MSEDTNGDIGTTNILFVAGAIGIGIWFLTTAGEAAGSGVSPIYLTCFFAPICIVWLLVYLLVNVLSSFQKDVRTIVDDEKSSPENPEEGKKAQVSDKQIFLLAFIGLVVLILFTIVLGSKFQ